MIKSFIHKGLEDFFYKDMNYPSSGLHQLLPKTKGRWAIKVSGNWRSTFEFIKKYYYENTKKTAVSSGIDSQASLLGTVGNQRYRLNEREVHINRMNQKRIGD